MIGPCGIACTVCRYYRRGLCEGCVRGNLCPPAKGLLSPCPVLRCAAARKIPYCNRDCPEFPCLLFKHNSLRCWFPVDASLQEIAPLDYETLTRSPTSFRPLDAQQSNRKGLRVFCLGSFRVYRDSEEIQDHEWGQGKGPTQKIKTMFAYLLSRDKRGTRKDTLIDLLWPNQSNHDRASDTFHLTLHCLRRALEPDLKSMTASSYIQYKRGRYRFDPVKPYWLDADAFESYCRQAETYDRHGESETAKLYWGMAAGVYEGDYMAGIHPDFTADRNRDWCLPQRQYLRELYLNALLEMAHYSCNKMEFETCLNYAYQILEVDPCFEEVHRLAIQCLIKSRQFDCALRQYRTCEAELASYENRAPSGQTRQLYQELTKSLTGQ